MCKLATKPAEPNAIREPRKPLCFPGRTDGIRGSAGKGVGLVLMQVDTHKKQTIEERFAEAVCLLLPQIVRRELEKSVVAERSTLSKEKEHI